MSNESCMHEGGSIQGESCKMGTHKRREKCASQVKSIKVREVSEREGESYVREGENE